MKFTNRYTTNKDYFSYEKDYLYMFNKHIAKPYKEIGLKCMVSLETVEQLKSLHFKIPNTTYSVNTCYSLAMFIKSYCESYPVFYIDKNFLELAKRTDLPCETKITNFFVENAIFLLPKTEDIKFIIFSKDYTVIENGIITPCFYFNDYSRFFPFVDTSREHKKDCFKILKEKGYSERESIFFVKLLPQIFLYMATYQEKGMSVVSESKGIGFKKSKEKLLTPPIIGFNERHYINQQRQSFGSNPDLQGIKKQTHWRRGHWRQYDDGKLTWVRPCIINPCEV